MHYKENREQSAELLRLVLSHMTRHAAGFHPMSYAVWYEYLANINPHLRAAVDALIAGGTVLSDEDVVSLYQRHVAQRDLAASEQASAQIARIVQQVGGAASEAGAQMRSYGTGLDDYRQQLLQESDPQQLDEVLRSLIDHTQRVQLSTDHLQEELRRNSEEVEQLRAELEVAQGLASRDPLTGLLNRRGFDQELQREWTDGQADRCMLMVDVDRFKSINDAHGHLLGDKVIVAVARALQHGVGTRGPVARIGGEEFAAVLLGMGTDTACAVADQIRSAVERGRIRRAEGADSVGGVTVSIGVAGWSAGESIESLMSRADRALYQAKSAGRNRVMRAEHSGVASVA